MPKKAAVRLWHLARDFDRGTHQPGRHGGAVGHTALQVLHALIFDFMNFRTGRLDPLRGDRPPGGRLRPRRGHGAERLRDLGILHWLRRCAESWRDGRFVLEQETNAYAVLPDSQWRGYRPPQEPPAPAPGTPGANRRPCRLCWPRRRWRAGKLAAKPISDHVQRMKTTVLATWGLALLAGCAGIADTTPPLPAAGTQFDGSYVGQDTLLSGVAFLCGAADLPERIEVQNGQFAYPFQVNPPRVAPLPVQVFEDGTLAGQMQYGTLLEEDSLLFARYSSYRLGNTTRTHHWSGARSHDHQYTLCSAAEGGAEMSCQTWCIATEPNAR